MAATAPKKKKRERKKRVTNDGVRDGDNIIDDDGEDWEARARKAEGVCELMKKDWALLNAKLNYTASRNRWCSEYEDRLHRYNADMSTLRLVGRASQDMGREPDPYLQSAEVFVAHLVNTSGIHLQDEKMCGCPACQNDRRMAPSPEMSGGPYLQMTREEYERRREADREAMMNDLRRQAMRVGHRSDILNTVRVRADGRIEMSEEPF